MKLTEAPRPRKTGRPLSFDRAAALEIAMEVFWRKGYEGASIADLVTAMGVTPPSLYTAFGDKKRLFLEALERYISRPGLELDGLLRNAPTAKDAVWMMLKGATIQQTRDGLPHGCMLMSAFVSSPPTEPVQEAIVQVRSDIEAALSARLERAIDEGELPSHTYPHVLAGFVMSVIQGISVQARDGATREKLQGMAELAFRAWPV